MKKTIALLLALMLTLSCCFGALADCVEDDGYNPDGNYFEEDDSAEDLDQDVPLYPDEEDDAAAAAAAAAAAEAAADAARQASRVAAVKRDYGDIIGESFYVGDDIDFTISRFLPETDRMNAKGVLENEEDRERILDTDFGKLIYKLNDKPDRIYLENGHWTFWFPLRDALAHLKFRPGRIPKKPAKYVYSDWEQSAHPYQHQRDMYIKIGVAKFFVATEYEDCYGEGECVSHCAVCGNELYNERADVTSHDAPYTETCFGRYYYGFCTRCGMGFDTEYHTGGDCAVKDAVVRETCTTTYIGCPVCGYIYSEEYQEGAKHNWTYTRDVTVAEYFADSVYWNDELPDHFERWDCTECDAYKYEAVYYCREGHVESHNVPYTRTCFGRYYYGYCAECGKAFDEEYVTDEAEGCAVKDAVVRETCTTTYIGCPVCGYFYSKEYKEGAEHDMVYTRDVTTAEYFEDCIYWNAELPDHFERWDCTKCDAYSYEAVYLK